MSYKNNNDQNRLLRKNELSEYYCYICGREINGETIFVESGPHQLPEPHCSEHC